MKEEIVKVDSEKRVNKEDNLKAVLIKRALGYDVTETIEEYVKNNEGEITLSKKKITTKNVPPDLSAIKLLLEEECSIEEMTDEQLEKEKKRLLKLLKESEQSIRSEDDAKKD